MHIEDFIVHSHSAVNVDQLFALYQRAMSELGYDRVVFSLMTDHPSINRKAGHGIASNYPDDWMQYYVEQEFEALDPVRAGMYATAGTFVWSDMQKSQPLTRSQHIFMNEAVDAGLHAGIGIPLRGTHGAIAGVGAASSDPHIEADQITRAKAQLFSTQFYNVYLTLESLTADMPPISITDREREILQLVAKGLTRKEIARELNISPNTVNIHNTKILKKFMTTSMTVATLRALRQYLIQVV